MSLGIISLNKVRMLKSLVTTKLKKTINVAFSEKYLFYTNVGISFTLSGLGDVLEQHYEIITEQMNKWDRERTRKMAITGITVGIVCHHYYAILDRRLPGTTFKILVKKVLIDQLVCSPLCIGVFLATVSYLEGANWKECKENIKNKAWRLYTADWVVWPPAQFINFYFVPPKYRVLYDNTISLGYDVYTSYVNHDKSSETSIGT